MKNLYKVNIVFLITVFIALSSCMTVTKTDLTQESIKPKVSSQNEQIALGHYLNGLTLKEMKKYNEALVEFNRALSFDSNYAICYAAASIYFELNNYQIAEILLRNSLQQKPNYIEAYKLLFDLYSNEGLDIGLITQVADKIYQIEPNNENKFKYASFLSFVNKPKANSLLIELIDTEYKQSALSNLIQNSRLVNDTTAMLKYLETLYMSDKTNFKVAQELTYYYLQNLNRYNSFLPILNEMDNSLQMNYLANIYLAVLRRTIELEHDSTFANNLIERVKSKFEKDSEILLNIAKLSFKVNNIKQADVFFEKAIASDIEIPEILLDISNFFIYLEKFEKASGFAARGSKNFPKDYRFPYLESLVHSSMNEIAKAKSFMLLSLKIDSTFANSWSQLGLIYDSEKNSDSAEYCYEKALMLSTDPNALTLNNYAYSLADKDKNLQKAKQLSQQALEIEPDNYAFLDTYGWICYKLGNYQDAIDYLKKSLSLAQENPETLEHLGTVYKDMGKDDEALFYFSKAINLDPTNMKLVEKIKLLKR